MCIVRLLGKERHEENWCLSTNWLFHTEIIYQRSNRWQAYLLRPPCVMYSLVLWSDRISFCGAHLVTITWSPNPSNCSVLPLNEKITLESSIAYRTKLPYTDGLWSGWVPARKHAYGVQERTSRERYCRTRCRLLPEGILISRLVVL